jgi:putative beta barrel porin BBP7
MKRSIPMSCLVLAVYVASVRAQSECVADRTLDQCLPQCRDAAVCGPPGRVWARADYLLWWVKGSPLPPLLTTSPSGTPIGAAGILGESATAVLFGDESVAGGARSGGRFTLGYWLNEQQTCGLEGSFFFLEQEGEQFAASSPGTPILARPFFDVTFPGQNALLVAYPGTVAGAFRASLTSNLGGADVNLRANLCCDCDCRLDLLAGYRFQYFNENLRINEREISTDPSAPLPVGAFIDLFDGFRTRNDFHGGQLGLAGEYRRGRWIVQATGKVALGATNRKVEISGFTQEVGMPAAPGGFLASQTNMGRYHDARFSVIPEANLDVGYQVGDRLRVFVGYTFLYWTGVARPGNQIDLAVNPTQLPPGVLEGEPRPAFQFRDSDIWLQGIHFGLEYRF